jgi:endonuclease/exonuclease/phosphatase family metal-dependent hydrolase
VDELLTRIREIAGDLEMLVAGDFNLTFSQSSCSERPVRKRDLAIQARLVDEFGLFNCWQEANPDQPLHQTLRWTRDRATAYHCDGIFVPKSWRDRLQSWVVLSGDDWNSLSDHNPVVAEFREGCIERPTGNPSTKRSG